MELLLAPGTWKAAHVGARGVLGKLECLKASQGELDVLLGGARDPVVGHTLEAVLKEGLGDSAARALNHQHVVLPSQSTRAPGGAICDALRVPQQRDEEVREESGLRPDDMHRLHRSPDTYPCFLFWCVLAHLLVRLVLLVCYASLSSFTCMTRLSPKLS